MSKRTRNLIMKTVRTIPPVSNVIVREVFIDRGTPRAQCPWCGSMGVRSRRGPELQCFKCNRWYFWED